MEQTHRNLLVQGEAFESWKRQEQALWSRSVQKYYALSIIVGAAVRLLGQVFVEFTNWTTVAILFIALITPSAAIIKISQRETVQKIQTLVFLTGAQLYGAFMALHLYPNNLSLMCVSSTVVFCLYEMPSFSEWWVTLLLLARQYALWKISAVSLGLEVASWSLPYYMFIGISVLILYFTRELKKRMMERYRLCDVIEEQHCNLRNILQAIPEGLAVVTETMDIPCVNSKCQSILQSSAETMLQSLRMMKCSESEVGIEGETLLQQISTFIQIPNKASGVFGITKVEEKHYEWKGTKCVWGKSKACILTASDISSWVSVRSKLQQESDSKTSLLRFVSHELRTPTNAILNLVSNVMAAENLKQDQKTDLSIVITSTHFLLSVINDLLDFSRMIADRFSLVKQSFDIRKELHETVQLIELQCAQKGLFLTIKVDELVPQTVYSDPNRLKQVLLNLLGNALKFTFHGGIRVICMMTDSNSLKISVKDTGVGIPSHKIAGLCQAFGTIEGTERINPQGCGLGLYISNLLVQCLGAKTICISSKVAVGSEFSFELAIYQEEIALVKGVKDCTTEEIEDERESELQICAKPYTGGKGTTQCLLPDVLVVDDFDFNRIVLVKMLESLGMPVDTATTGLRALSAIREGIRRGHCYRLILMDVEMPEMDGVTATQEIRTMELTGELAQSPRIIACSAHRGTEEYDRCIRAGMDGYLEKPISRLKLQELISQSSA